LLAAAGRDPDPHGGAILPASALLALLLELSRSPDSLAVRAPADTAHADSSKAPPYVVRNFPTVEVRATVHDPGSSETVHVIPGSAMRTLPVDGLAEALALQPGVVIQAEELHVRGGRSGETIMFIDGIALNEPHRHQPVDVPLLGLASADLVSGAPEAQHGAGLAGALVLRTVNPGPRPSFAWSWQTALGDRWYDRWAGRISTPLPFLPLGLVAAADGTLDDAQLPELRSETKRTVAGIPFDLRADNRALGMIKIAPVEHPERFSAQVLTSHRLLRPYDPAWSSVISVPPVGYPGGPNYQPGYVVYNAADHLGVTDDRRMMALLSLARVRPARRLSTSLGWVRRRAITSLNGESGLENAGSGVIYDPSTGFYVVAGDYPLYRETGSDVLTLRADEEASNASGNSVKTGAGVTYEEVSLFERDNSLGNLPVDRDREYQAYAPGAFAYLQARWKAGGLLMNTGLRAEYFTPGPQGRQQTLPWDGNGLVSLSPRLGLAYPMSDRDAFSLAYARIHQPPGRDFLYDHRQVASNRQPLGNPALQPSTVITYEAAVKHVFNLVWSLQGSVFYRDIYGQVGTRNIAPSNLPAQLAYEDSDDGHAAGFEWSVVRAVSERERFEVNYTFLQAWGTESLAEGDPYRPVRGLQIPPIAATPLSWDRRHSLQLAAAWPWRETWSFSWSTIVGSPLPWTPKPRRQTLTDLGVVNSERLKWTESTNVNARWTPSFLHGLTFGLEARNLFDDRSERAVTVDGYPNPLINTVYDDYSAYRTETGQGGGAFWVPSAPGSTTGTWVPVNDARLFYPPRAVRLSVGANW
jgi:hypothetical protein